MNQPVNIPGSEAQARMQSDAGGFGTGEHGIEQGMSAGEAHDNALSRKLNVLGKGVATGLVVSTISQTGRQIAGKLINNPWFVFGLGFVTGYFAHKYRGEIIATAGSAARQGSRILFSQPESRKGLPAESRE